MVAIGGITLGAVEYALRGLQQRADVRANNVSNHATPGFRGQQVDFETALQTALTQRSDGPVAAPVAQPTTSMPDAHGNTVNLEDELVGMIKDNLQRDTMINAYNGKVAMLRSAITGR